MTPADLKRLQKYMLEVEGTDPILDEMRAVVETEWPELIQAATEALMISIPPHRVRVGPARSP